MEESRSGSHILINLFICLIIIILAIYLCARYIEHSQIIMKEYRISNENIPSNFSGIKIVHLSDIYFGNTTGIDEMINLVDKINSVNPDLIIFTGNLYGNNIKKEEKLQEVLLKLESKLGKYAVKGNNDYYDNYETFMQNIGFEILNNDYELIYYKDLTPIFLCGLNSYLKEGINLDNCNEYFDNNEQELYKIYAIHESDAVDSLTDSHPNLILSGNSLGGLVKIPFYGEFIIPNGSKKYYKDHYKINGIDMYISSGIGTNDIPYRFLNKPSFNLYRLKALN